MDGERKKRLEKRVGVHLENQDHQKNVNGIETKRGIETVKIERRTRRTPNEKGTEREMGTGRIASEDPGWNYPTFVVLLHFAMHSKSFLMIWISFR